MLAHGKLVEIKGTLVEAVKHPRVAYVVHQVDCVSTRATRGHAKALFRAFPSVSPGPRAPSNPRTYPHTFLIIATTSPQADIYGDRGNEPDTAGEVRITGKILHLLGQYHPGPPNDKQGESPNLRLYFFEYGLKVRKGVVAPSSHPSQRPRNTNS